jgi:multidrug efflux pump
VLAIFWVPLFFVAVSSLFGSKEPEKDVTPENPRYEAGQ